MVTPATHPQKKFCGIEAEPELRRLVSRHPLARWERRSPQSAAPRYTIRWNSGATGIYHSRLNPYGQAFGTTWDMYGPSSQATWWMVDSARCIRWT